MPKCNECGADIFIDSRFCPECGAKVDFSKSEKSDEKPSETDKDKQDETKSEKTDKAAADNTPSDDKSDKTEKTDSRDSSDKSAKDKKTDETDIKEIEKEAEHALEDLPDIKPVDGIEIPDTSDDPYKVPEAVRKAVKKIDAEKKPDDQPNEDTAGDNAPSVASAPEPAEKPARKRAPVLIYFAVLAIILIGLFKVLGKNDTRNIQPPVSETVAVPIETTSVEITSETEPAPETTTAAQTTVTTVQTTTVTTAESDPDASTSETAPVLMRTTIEPAAHEQVMGRAVSCTVTLSEALITPDMLSDTSKFTAEYTAVSDAPMAPVSLLVIIGGDEIYVPASSFDDKNVVFGCDAVRAYVEDSGHSFDEINELAFISSGVPVDVSKVIIE